MWPNRDSIDVTVIDGLTNSVAGTVADPNAVGPTASAVNLATNTIYVANSTSNNLTVIDGATYSVTATISIGVAPAGAAVDSQTNFVYVANFGGSTRQRSRQRYCDGWRDKCHDHADRPEREDPAAVAVNSATSKIYVANSGSNNVTVIDGAH